MILKEAMPKQVNLLCMLWRIGGRAGMLAHLRFAIIFTCVCAMSYAGESQAANRNPFRVASHSNFIRAHYYSVEGMQEVGCASNASLCLDLTRNPDISRSTCCWNKFCKDITSDNYHCGGCGQACAFGLTCCDSYCVDLQNDEKHCGSCDTCCQNNEKCDFGMCGYAGGASSSFGHEESEPHYYPRH